jgi:hypothetical protein
MEGKFSGSMAWRQLLEANLPLAWNQAGVQFQGGYSFSFHLIRRAPRMGSRKICLSDLALSSYLLVMYYGLV